MKTLVEEYGLFVVCIVGVCFFFYVWSEIFFGDKGVETVYSTWSPTISTIMTDKGTYSEVVDNSTAPYFYVDSSKSYIILDNSVTKSDFLSGIKAYYNNSEISEDDITVIVYEYKPLIWSDVNDVNGHVVMTSEYMEKMGGYDALVNLDATGKCTEVFALDKYGNYIYDDEGKKVVSEQPIYFISDGKILKSNEYIDTSNASSKYKVVYRVQKGTLKAEYDALFIKKGTINDTENPLDDYEKIDFNYAIDDSPVLSDVE